MAKFINKTINDFTALKSISCSVYYVKMKEILCSME